MDCDDRCETSPSLYATASIHAHLRDVSRKRCILAAVPKHNDDLHPDGFAMNDAKAVLLVATASIHAHLRDVAHSLLAAVPKLHDNLHQDGSVTIDAKVALRFISTASIHAHLRDVSG